jgi:hypothetical protein
MHLPATPGAGGGEIPEIGDEAVGAFEAFIRQFDRLAVPP